MNYTFSVQESRLLIDFIYGLTGCAKLNKCLVHNGLLINMNPSDFTNEKLWQILFDAVHTNVMYPTHKAYTRDVIIQGKLDITPEELSLRLNISLGEAIVILYELAEKVKSST